MIRSDYSDAVDLPDSLVESTDQLVVQSDYSFTSYYSRALFTKKSIESMNEQTKMMSDASAMCAIVSITESGF